MVTGIAALTRAPVVLAAGSTLAAVGTALGLSPLVAVALSCAAWLLVAWPRLGAPLSIGTVIAGWIAATFAASVVSHLLRGDPAVVTACASAVLAAVAATVAVVSPARATSAPQFPGTVLIGSLAGGFVWTVGVIVGAVRPGGSGLTWASYVDSSFDMFGMRQVMWANGQRPMSGNPRPLEHVVSASFLSPGHVVDASRTSVEQQLIAHATHWSVLIVLACFLSGVTVALFAARAKVRSGRLAVLACAVSVSTLAMPITGAVIDYGQINAHLVIVLMLSSVIVAYEGDRNPPVAVAALVVLAALALVSWTPFAAVPGILAIYVAVRHRVRLRQHTLQTLAWVGPPALFAAWLFGAYSSTEVIRIVTSPPEDNEARATTETMSGFTNPYSWTLTLVLVTALVVGLVLIRRRDRLAAAVGTTAMAGFALGMLPLALARGGLGGSLEYYPAKYLSLATIAMAPIAIGILVRACVSDAARAPRVAAVASLAALAIVAILTPTPPGIDRAALAPWNVATGAHFGSKTEVADAVLALTTNDARTVLWRSGNPRERTINLMLAVVDRDQAGWNTMARHVIRTYGGDTSTELACMLGDADDWPVALVTADPLLSDEVQESCPGAGLEIVLVSQPETAS